MEDFKCKRSETMSLKSRPVIGIIAPPQRTGRQRHKLRTATTRTPDSTHTLFSNTRPDEVLIKKLLWELIE